MRLRAMTVRARIQVSRSSPITPSSQLVDPMSNGTDHKEPNNDSVIAQYESS
jgi:hypothetical protein